ncbi:unnamed protein product, partial [Ectocarpus sp. 6 AP-2014]
HVPCVREGKRTAMSMNQYGNSNQPQRGPAQQPPPPQSNPTGGSYFVDQKKGEINELKQLLRAVSVDRDPKKKREVIKKVIAYMTLGIDVSRLFTEMMLAIETRDLVVKKMVYLYLCTYARQKPDLAIMCINTLQRDCNNQDPMVRGLALRSLCSLRLPAMVEYISDPLKASLTDANSYVRKTGVMAILKMWHLWPQAVEDGAMVDTLYNMLQDTDAQVVANCVVVLNEIMADAGGMATNTAIVHHLLGRLEDFNEWGVCHILALVSRHEPADEDEAFEIMNLVDPVLRTSNSGAVLAAVYERTKAPLLTLMAGGSSETVYCILKHLEGMLPRCPGVFDDEYRQFFTRYNEPTGVKYAKVRCLALLADSTTAEAVIAELGEYAGDMDPLLARQAMRAVGKICLRLPGSAAAAIERLIDLMGMDVSYVKAEAVQVVEVLLRKYPQWRTEVLPSLQRCLKHIDEPAGKAAVIWMVGEYGDEITEAPYMLEPLVDAWEEEPSCQIKMHLLTAAVKLFFKRPPEMQSMLGRLLARAVNDLSSQDLHDRALLYHRLLKHDPEVARRVCCCERPPVSGEFAEDRDTGRRDVVFSEFNTLSMVYDDHSDNFTLPEFRAKKVKNTRAIPGEAEANDLADLGLALERSKADQQQLYEAAVAAPAGGGGGTSGGDVAPPAAAAPEVDLLGLMGGDENGGGWGGEGSQAAPTAAGGGVEFQTGITINSGQFQSLWAALGAGVESSFEMSKVPASTQEVEGLLTARGVNTMASGNKPAAMKFFFYAKDVLGSTYLMQCSVLKPERLLELVVKSDAPDPSESARVISGVVKEAFASYLR